MLKVVPLGTVLCTTVDDLGNKVLDYIILISQVVTGSMIQWIVNNSLGQKQEFFKRLVFPKIDNVILR